MKKLLLSFLVLILCTINVQAKSVKRDLSQIINDTGIKKESVAISIRDAKTGGVVYSLNDKNMMNPASVQKVLTMTAAENVLGKDYKFSTELYSLGKDRYLIKLSGDPYLKYSDLKQLTKPIKLGVTDIYIDDSVLDSKYWGEGWQWDDDMNCLMQRFGAYNLDENLIKLIVMPSVLGQSAKIINPSKYPLVFMNNVITSKDTSIEIKRDTTVSNNILVLNGTVAGQSTFYIPSNNIKRYFEIRLTEALGENKIYLKNPFQVVKKSSNCKLENKVEREFANVLDDVLKNSNNMAAETVFKVAGGKFINGIGTDTSGIEMFKDFCAKKNLNASDINITDGSGVSKNNLMTADFISEFLYINKDSDSMNHLPSPGEGTLAQRLLPVRESLKAKTGTLSNISSIAGFITTKKGNKYTFCIMQNDVKLSPSDKKMLEDYMIREIYLKL